MPTMSTWIPRILIPLVAALPALAYAQEEIDAATGAPAAYTPVAPVEYPQPAIDVENPQLPPGGGGPDNSAQQVSIDITTGGSTASDYVALLLDRDPDDWLLIKVQQQDGSGKFSHVGFYHKDDGSGGWAGMTGGAAFFALAAADKFTSARMSVTHDGAGNVTLKFTNVVGGTNNQTYVRGGWVPRAASSAGIGTWNGVYSSDNWGVAFTGDAVCDNFNRPNGSLGPNWILTTGTASISANKYKGGAGFARAFFVGGCGVVVEVEADVAITGTSNGNSGLVLNDDGTDRLFIKVQQQTGSGKYDSVGFYHTSGPTGTWPGITGGAGFFLLPAAQQFSNAHMRVTVDNNGTVRLILTNINGVAGDFLEYSRGGWTILGGLGIGFGGWTGNSSVDNISSGGSLICDNFNRPNGPLGANWSTILGTASISNQKAFGDNSSVSIFTGLCGGCNDPTGPIVEITAPASFACACGVIQVIGTVDDPEGYDGDVLEYRASNSDTWINAGSASGSVINGLLYNFNTGPLAEGYYYLRVVGKNDCGASNSDDTLIYVNKAFDTVSVGSPVNNGVYGGTLCATGSVYENNCFANYTVMYKPLLAGAFAPVDPGNPVYNSGVINGTLGTWMTDAGPTAVPDGAYQVRVRGTDSCGNIKEVIRNVTIDNTAPIAVLTAPVSCDWRNGIIAITGTANDANFSGWTLQRSVPSGGWVTIASGNAPVINGVFANWNTAGLPKCAYTIRLIVSDKSVIDCGPFVQQSEDTASFVLGCEGDLDFDGVVGQSDLGALLANYGIPCP